jgi:hypothetical protein
MAEITGLSTNPTTAPTGAIGRESSLSNWAGPYVTDMLGKGWAASEMPYYGYEGPLTADASQLQQQAFQGIGSIQPPPGFGTFDPSSFQGGIFDSAAAAQYMNPYLQNALNPQIDEARRQSEIQRIQNAGRLTKAGAFGGSRQAIMESEGDRNLGQNLANIVGTGYRDAYDKGAGQFSTDQDRRLRAEGMGEASRQFGAGFGLQGLGSLLDLYGQQAGMGATQRGIEQEGINADYAQFQEERDYPYKNIQFMQSLLQGLPLEAQNYEFQDLNLLQKIVGGVEGGASLIDAIMDLFGSGSSTTPTDGSYTNPTPTTPPIDQF